MWNRNADSQPRQKRPPSPTVDDRRMDERAILAQAAHQARAGHHTAALGLLDRLATEGAAPSAAAFDLRARINAQLGFQLEAERCWVLASRADPTNPLYPLALERLRQARRPGPVRRGTVLILAAMTALALLVGQGLQQSAELRAIEGQLASDRALDRQHWDEASQRHDALAMTTTRGMTDLEAVLIGLSDRLDHELPRLESVLVASLNGSREQHANLVAGLAGELGGKTDALETAVTDLASRLDQTLPKLAHDASISARLETLDERQTNLKDELSAQIAGFAQTAHGGLDAERMARQGLQEALARIEGRLDQLHEHTEGRFTTISAGVDSLRTGGVPEALPRAAPLAAPEDTSGRSSLAPPESDVP